MSPTNENERRGSSFLGVLGSVLASMFGVQSSSKHQEDFAHGKAIHYILVGLLVTAVFILSIWGVVKLVLSAANQ